MASSAGPPVYLSIRETARLLGWPYRRTQRFLVESDLIVVRCGRPLVSTDRIRDLMPELWDKFLIQFI